MSILLCRALLLSLLFGNTRSTRVEAGMSKNPIRKVVTLMQNMQKEVEAEGEREKDLHEKFMCYCTTTAAQLTKSKEDASASIDELTSKMRSSTAAKTQLSQELAEHKQDRASAKADLDEASSLRAKENSEFAANQADSETNIAALGSAIPALEKGMSGSSFMQMSTSGRVRELVSSYPNIDAPDRRNVLAFLDQDTSGDYVPQSGQIVGILKQMKDDFEANLKAAVADEQNAANGFGALAAQKQKEIEVATESIESKMGRAGELAVAIVQAKDGLEDSQAELNDSSNTLASLTEECASQDKAYDAAAQGRADEVSAISQAVQILNNDDALETFSKAAPSAPEPETNLQQTDSEWGASVTGFLQTSMKQTSRAQRAEAILQKVSKQQKLPQYNLMLLSIRSQLHRAHGGSQKFEEVLRMVDQMVVLLGKQQEEDDSQKEWCREEFDTAEDEQKAQQSEVNTIDGAIEELSDSVATITEEIKGLTEGVADLDKSVADATLQRKEEHAAYVEAVQVQTAAIALVEKAKTKLAKVYSPSLLQAPTPQTDFQQAASFVQVRSHDSFSNNRGTGIMALLDHIIHDTEMSTKESENTEKAAQADYAKTMGYAQETRAQDMKSITDKTEAKADMEVKLVGYEKNKGDSTKELLSAAKYLSDLHGSCDFIISNYDLRKEARASEMDSLKNAKAMLSGAKDSA